MSCCGQLLLSLISNILDYAKLNAHEVVCAKSPISLSDSIDTAIMVARQLAKKKGTEIDEERERDWDSEKRERKGRFAVYFECENIL